LEEQEKNIKKHDFVFPLAYLTCQWHALAGARKIHVLVRTELVLSRNWSFRLAGSRESRLKLCRLESHKELTAVTDLSVWQRHVVKYEV
jgi:hypothetical protein